MYYRLPPSWLPSGCRPRPWRMPSTASRNSGRRGRSRRGAIRGRRQGRQTRRARHQPWRAARYRGGDRQADRPSWNEQTGHSTEAGWRQSPGGGGQLRRRCQVAAAGSTARQEGRCRPVPCFNDRQERKKINEPLLSRRRLLLSALATVALPAWAAPARPRVDVWKDPNCQLLRRLGQAPRSGRLCRARLCHGRRCGPSRLGLPDAYASCHTALVDGYVLEGHVPAADIRRLLADKPKALGLAVPGIPVGSPGMDGPVYQGRRNPYEVLLVSRDGRAAVSPATVRQHRRRVRAASRRRS